MSRQDEIFAGLDKLDEMFRELDEEPKDEAEDKAVKSLVLTKAVGAMKKDEENAAKKARGEIPEALKRHIPSKIQGSKMTTDGL